MKLNVSLEDVIDKIINETQKSKKEILERIEEKKEDLGGLITDEGAACIVAKDLGVEIFEPSKDRRKYTKIKDLLLGMNAISLIGKVAAIFPPREFTFKSGKRSGETGKRAKFLLQDDTGQILVVLWNDQVHLISDGTIQENEIVEIRGAYTKSGLNNQLELQLGKQALLTPKPEDVDTSILEKISLPYTKIAQIQHPMNVNLIGRINWKGKITSFERGQVANISVYDETDQIPVALWREHADFINQIEEGDGVRIINAYTRERSDGSIDLNLGTDSKILKDPAASKTIPENPKFRPLLTSVIEIKINEITPESRRIKVVGKIIEKSEPRTTQFSDSSEHKVCEALLADDTGSVSLSIWDSDIDKVELNKTYVIENGYASVFRNQLQLNIGRFGKIYPSDQDLPTINLENNISQKELPVRRKRLDTLTGNEVVEVLGTIVSFPEQRPYYYSCPNCRKKVSKNEDTWICERCGPIPEPITRMLYSFIFDDGTQNIRVTISDAAAETLLGLTVSEAEAMVEDSLIAHLPLTSKAKDLLGQELLIKGTVRYSKFNKGFELSATDISIPNPKKETTFLLESIENLI
ncbi:MAG: DUF2240 family protein [Candidatus Helarchaeota archaeon]